MQNKNANGRLKKVAKISIAGIQKVRRIDEISAFWGIMNGRQVNVRNALIKNARNCPLHTYACDLDFFGAL